MERDIVKIALISDVFFGHDDRARLLNRLRAARGQGAVLAILPELPLDPWIPANKVARDDDAEGPGRRRHAVQSAAAREVGIALVGGAIVRDPTTGRRYNTALMFDPAGELVMSYRKLHLPEEEGFWETSHYIPGDRPPMVSTALDLAVGVQICSDINRPTLCHVLGAAGAELIAHPRATEPATFERWKLVLRGNAMTCATYIASVNRPPEDNANLGGASLLVAPDGRVLIESTDPVAIGEIDRFYLDVARRQYPGYLDVQDELYARAWAQVGKPKA